MIKEKIKNSDLEISKIIYGCMKLSNWDSDLVNAEEIKRAELLIENSLSSGINTFDHADIYCQGKAEKVFGEILKNKSDLRDKIIIQSKCGIRFQDKPEVGFPGRYDFSYDHIIKSVDGSLSRLGTDYLDVLLLHRPDALMEPEEVAKAFDKLLADGKVKYFGVSNFNWAQIDLLQKYIDQKILFNQVELNLLHNNLINDGVIANVNSNNYSSVAGTLDYCRKNDIYIQAWSPLARGVFTSVPDGSEEKIYNTSKFVYELAKAKETTSEAIVVSWLLKHPARIFPVLGTANPERLKNCIKAEKVNLTREEWYKLFILARGEALP